MNWLDNVIGFFNPRAGCEREAWRQNLSELRNYDAGDWGRLNSNWRARNESAELTDKSSRDTVRARARDLERNSDMANAVIGAYKRNVIGAGFSLQARTGNDELNNEIEALWKKWCKKQNCDITEQQSFNQILRMIIERKKVDGGILIHKVYNSSGVIPFKLQCIEVDEIDTSPRTARNKGNRVVSGVEVNSYNKPVGYWIKRYSIDGILLTEPMFIEADKMIYIFTKKRPSQVREISDLAPTITRIRDVNEFMNAVSVKERIAACLSVFIKKAITSLNGGFGRASEGKEKYNYNGKTLTPGMIQYLNPGDEVETVNPSGQAADAASFIKIQQRLISSGQGISYEAMSRDMSESTYSSARQGIIEDEMTYAEDKELILETASEIYETFVISAILSGKLNVPDFWNNKDMYLNHEWIQVPKKWIDPAKESTANQIALKTGQKTFKQIAAEAGRDWREHIDDLAEAEEYANSKGISLLGGEIIGQADRTE